MSLPQAIQALTSSPAAAIGLLDRGQLAVGYKADINVIDYDRLQLRAPHVRHDLPSDGKRMVQLADGYAATVISGVATHLDGKPTGGMPGRLVRGAQPSPGPSDK